LNRAVELAEYALMFDNPNEINTRYQRLDKVNAADVQRIARQYLTPENRTVIITRPKAAAGPGGR
jgi:predicted Zn-dependent peptidase